MIDFNMVDFKVELLNIAQDVFKITMDLEDQKEVVVLPNLMGQGENYSAVDHPDYKEDFLCSRPLTGTAMWTYSGKVL